MMLHMFFSAQIDDSVASLIIAQLLFLQSESNNKPIHMYINSPGKMVFFIKSSFANLPIYLGGGGLASFKILLVLEFETQTVSAFKCAIHQH